MNQWTEKDYASMKAILLATGRPWVARNHHGHLWAHKAKPKKGQLTWISYTQCCELAPDLLPGLAWGDPLVNIQEELKKAGK